MKDKIVKLGISEIEAQELINVSKDINKDYDLLLKQYPIQYLIGYVNFYGYKILVDNRVLIPRYETEYLVEKTINYIKRIFDKKKIKILDLCTGSGAIAIAIQKELNANVSASDISKEALDLASENAKINDSSIDFIKSDLLNNINERFDVIISNPPYISKNEEIMESVKKYEPHLALYAEDNGLYNYDKILGAISKNINNKYLIAFEIGCTQGEEISKMINKYLPKSRYIIEKDLSNKDRYVFIFSE